MDAIFGDATTAVATPNTLPETGSLLGASSPVPSMDLRRGIQSGGPQFDGLGPASAIPGLEIDPPHVSIVNGKPQYASEADSSEGVGGWISRIVSRTRGDSASVRSGRTGDNSRYKPLDQEEGDGQ
jgi:hypothetical protein